MDEEPENLTLRLLREMREEMRTNQDETRKGFADMRTDMHQGFADVRADMRAEMHQGFSEVRAEMHQGFAAIEARQDATDRTLIRVIDAITGIAKVQEQHSGLFVELIDRERITGGRLSAHEARLGRIEGKLDLVNA